MSRITPGTMIVAIFAVLFGLTGAYSVRKFMDRPVPAKVAEPPEQPPPPIYVPLAATDLDVGKPLTLGDIAIMKYTKEQVAKRIEDGKLPTDGYMSNPKQIVGRILKEPLGKGDAFETAKLYPEGMGPSVADRLKPGYRAVTIPVKDVGAVAGFAGPGSMVDVLFRAAPNAALGISESTVTLIEGAEVLALGEVSLPGTLRHGREGNVTLAVTADQANKLKVVEGRGEVSLSMRHPGDALAANQAALTLEQLLGIQKPVPPPLPPPPMRVEIYRGTSRQTLTFEQNKLTGEQGAGPVDAPPPPAPRFAPAPAPAVVVPPAATEPVDPFGIRPAP